MAESPHSLDKIETFFEGLTERGDSHQGVGWPTPENQAIRFENALRLIEPAAEPFTVNDLGCGLAHLYEFVHERGLPMHAYHGYDLSAKSLEMARERLGPDVELTRSDHLTTEADYSFACGIFNTRLEADDEEWLAFMKSVFLDLDRHSTRGFALTSLSTYVDYREPQLFYADPTEWFNFCKRELSPYVTLLHDYPIYEWTILVRSADHPWRGGPELDDRRDP